VKEISKGLMLHYPLDNNGMGCKNLLAGNFQSIATKEGTNNTGSLWVNKESIPTGNLNYLIGKTLIFSYEVSAEGNKYLPISSNLASRYGIHGALQGSGTFDLYPFADYLHYTGGAKRVVMKYTIPTTMTSITNLTFALQATNYPAADNNATWYIKNCKLEIANEATPWCPNERDELYSQLGMDDNIEYDTSGYGNNALKTLVNYNSGSPRYQTSTAFDGTSSGITVNPSNINPVLTQGGNNPFSYSFWIKNAANDRGIIFGDHMTEGISASISIEKYTGNVIRIWWRDLIDQQLSTVTLPLGEWVHIAITYNGSKLQVYKNGVMNATIIKTLTSLNKSPAT
jgi:hypothetical protein